MQYRIVKQKKGYIVIDSITGSELLTHVSLGRAKSFVEKKEREQRLRIAWLAPEAMTLSKRKRVVT